MSKIRVHELAKELGVENREVLDAAKEMGFSGKSSHSHSLEDNEAEALRRKFIRAAIGNAPDSEVVTTQRDAATGELRTVVESRKGNIVRRRRKGADAPSQEGPRAEVESQVEESAPLPDSIFIEKDDTDSAEQLDAVEVPSEEASDEEAPAAADEGDSAPVEEVEAVSGVEGTGAADAEKRPGPRVLGRIELPSKKPKPPQTVRAPVVQRASEEEDDGKKRGKGRRRTKKTEYSRGDLVDYDAKPSRRGGKGVGSGRGRDGRRAGEGDSAKREVMPQRASKRVVRMADESIIVADLAQQMSLKVSEIITKLIELGVMATINQAIDYDTASIIASEFEFTLEKKGFDEEHILALQEEDTAEHLSERSPVVTVMGHVDHGKTSLLDRIRQTSVAAREHGGITQHIGAYSVKLPDGRSVTFIDTPGHAAFTQMRARGAEVTDIVILVVAADDGVMPQTVEAINHSKAAGVSICVAINKMDRPDANPDKVKQQLAERGLQPEDWGGDVMCFPVSAETGQGVDELLERLLLLAEVKELRANPRGRVRGAIIESRQERGLGTVATVLVQRGTLKVGDIFVTGAEYGRIRSMQDDLGIKLLSAGPSVPVEIAGLNGAPQAGDDFIVVNSDAEAKQVAASRKARLMKKNQLALAGGPISLEEFSRRATQEQAAELNVILKADVHGSLEAVRDAVSDLSGEKVKVRVLHGAVGGVNESDVQLALASRAIIVGFGVRGEPRALAEAESTGIQVRFYRIIYELIDDVKKAMAGLLAPIREEVSLARIEVRDTFTIPKVGTVAGCYVISGTVKRGSHLRLLRDERVIHEGKMHQLRRFKDDVKEVQSGYECGVSFESFNDIKAGDVIEVFEYREIAATLE